MDNYSFLLYNALTTSLDLILMTALDFGTGMTLESFARNFALSVDKEEKALLALIDDDKADEMLRIFDRIVSPVARRCGHTEDVIRATKATYETTVRTVIFDQGVATVGTVAV